MRLKKNAAWEQALVSDKFRFIFVHVPKAGSTTAR
jgi:hypothetical protein